MTNTIRLLALVKGSNERFLFLYDSASRESRAETLRMLGRWACDPGINFNWYDCALLSQQVRQGVGVSYPSDSNSREKGALLPYVRFH